MPSTAGFFFTVETVAGRMKHEGTLVLIGNVFLICFLLVVDLVLVLDMWITAIVVAVVSMIISWISLQQRSADDLQDLILMGLVVGLPVFGLAALGAWLFTIMLQAVSAGVYVPFAVAINIIGIAFVVLSVQKWVRGIKASDTVAAAQETAGTAPKPKTMQPLRIDQSSKEPLQKLLKVSTKVKFDMLQGTLGISKVEFEKRIVDWAEQFGFTIEGDVLAIKGGNVDGFVSALFP